MVGGGARGLRLARELHAEGHAVRIVTRREERREAIEGAGAQCFIGDPQRLGTLRAALEHVTIACWLLAGAAGEPQAVAALHGSLLRQFLWGATDTTVRGVVYEAGGSSLAAGLLSQGEEIVREGASRNAIPVRVLRADPLDLDAWLKDALQALRSLL